MTYINRNGNGYRETVDEFSTYREALERVSDGFPVNRDDVQARALQRTVWVAEWHIPGCLSESFSICLSKADAIDSACSMAEGENGIPRGMKTALRKYGRFDTQSPMFGYCINTIERRKFADMF